MQSNIERFKEDFISNPLWVSLTLILTSLILFLTNIVTLIDIGVILFLGLSVSIVAVLLKQAKLTFKSSIFILLSLTIIAIHRFLLIQVYPNTFMHFNVNIHFIIIPLIACSVLLYTILKKKNIKNSFRFSLVFLFLGSITSTFYTIDKRLHILWLAWLVYFAANFYVSSFYLQDYKEKDPLKHWGLLTVIAISLILLLTSAIVKNYISNLSLLQHRARGIFTSPNSLGVFSATVSFFSIILLMRKDLIFKIAGVLLLIISIYNINISVSRNAVLSFLVGLGFLIFMLMNKSGSRRNLIVSIFATVVLIGIVGILFVLKFSTNFYARIEADIKGSDLSILLRVLMAKGTLIYLLKHPIRAILGSGLYQFYYYPFSYGLEKPHNILLDWWFSFGLFGILAFFSFLHVSYIKPLAILFKKRESLDKKTYLYFIIILSSLTTFWFSTLFDEVFWYPHHPILFAILPVYLVVTNHMLSTLDSSASD